MAQAPKLQLKQVLGLKLTPELKQSLEILQLGSLALTDFVSSEIEANPMLEFDPDWRSPRSRGGGGGSPQKAGPDISEIEGFVRVEKTLTDHVFDQLGFLMLNDEETRLAGHIIGCLNKAGYLTSPLDEIAAQFGCEIDFAEGVLRRLQGLEPAGLFAHNLKECLALQLYELGEEGEDSLRLLEHLEVLAKGDLKALSRATGLPPDRLGPAIRVLRALDPKPGERFASGDPVQSLIADVFVKPDKGGGFIVELNPETLPKILINETYSSALKQKGINEKDKKYLKTCRQRAGWLKRALDQRAKTILKVSESLVQEQAGFFTRGVTELKPLAMREIAEKTKVHESTVSRVAANKYLEFADQIYPLRFFFSSGVGGPGDEGVSAYAVKERIKMLIATEPKTKPLSDAKLAEVLKEEGIPVARRTVMKYRESLRIPSSFMRKKA